MKAALSPEVKEVIRAVHYKPAVSIIMPFEPKMSGKSEIVHQLKFATDKVERELRENYPTDLAALVIHKLKNIIKNLNFSTYKKSIAIYVSPVFEKILYLEIPVEEKIIIDDSFEIRDLVYAKKEIHKYLVMVLSGKSCKFYIGNTHSFIKVKSNAHENIAAFIHDLPERTSNFSDPSNHKQIMLKKFMHEIDEGLSFLLKTYRLPVFVMATPKVAGYFKANSKNEKSITGYVHGNYEESSEPELKDILKPYLNDWNKVKMKDLFLQMEKATDCGKLAKGMEEVWKQALHHRGRLLIVEKNFMYAAEHGSSYDVIHKITEPYHNFSHIKDAVDDIIEKILEQGGDVEFVDEDKLRNYGHIALILYY